MTTLTADRVSGPTLVQSFRAAVVRFLDKLLKVESGYETDDNFVWGRGL